MKPKEVTKTNPCPHCGKPDWCYSIDELTVCNRDFPPGDGWYQTSKTDKDGHYYYASIESRERFQLDIKAKKIRPAQKRIWYYPDRSGNPLVRVIRIDDGLGGKPRRWQESWNGVQWVKGLNGIKREDIPIYRLREVQSAILQGKDVYVVEGEICADALWANGIPATTNIGGSGKWRPTDTQDLLKSKVGVNGVSPVQKSKVIKRETRLNSGLEEEVKGIELETNEEKVSSKGETRLNSGLEEEVKGIELETNEQKADNKGESSFNSVLEGERAKAEKVENISEISEELDPWLDNEEIKSNSGQINSVNSVNLSTPQEKLNGQELNSHPDHVAIRNGEITQNLSQSESETIIDNHNVNNSSSSIFDSKFILCPDRDIAGIKHMEKISKFLPNTQWLYAFPQSPLWNVNLPESGGLDVADWIDELRNSYRFNDEQIKKTIFNSVEDVRPTLLSSQQNLEVKRQLVNNSSNPSAQSHNSPLINSQQPLSTTSQSTINHHQQPISTNSELGTIEQNTYIGQERKMQGNNYQLENMNYEGGKMNSEQQTGNSEPKTIPFLDQETLVGKLQELINIAPKKSVLTTIFNQLAKLIGLTTSEIRKLYNELTSESDLEIESPLRQEEINQLLALESENVNLRDYLPVEMVQPLQGMSEILGSNSVSQLTALLPVVASLINPETKLTLINKSKFTARPIFYSAIVAESGSAKSPTLNIFTEPLVKCMQKRAERVYQQSLARYEMAVADKNITEKPPKPKPLEYYVSDFTSEAIAEIIHNQPNKGFLMNFDELSGLIKQNNAYRGGKGADQEKILSGRDGTGWKVNRKNGDRFQNESSTYSIVGGITPDILRQQMGSCQDESGYWARFCYSYLPLKECKFPDDEANIDIYPLLCSLYENLESLPAYHYYLCSEGKALYREFFKEMEKKKMSEPNQAMRAVYSKSKRIAGEIALLLQSLHSAFYFQPDHQQTTNLNVILEPRFMAMGIKLAQRYIREIKAIYLKNEGDSENNLSFVYGKIINLSQRKGWLKARDLKQGDRHFRKLPSVDIRRYFQELVDLGFGETRGNGKFMEWRFNELQSSNSEVETTNYELPTQNLNREILKESRTKVSTPPLQNYSTAHHSIINHPDSNSETGHIQSSTIEGQKLISQNSLSAQHPNIPIPQQQIHQNTVNNVDEGFSQFTQEISHEETQVSSEVEPNVVEQVDVVDNQKQESREKQTSLNPPLSEKSPCNLPMQEEYNDNSSMKGEEVKPTINSENIVNSEANNNLGNQQSDFYQTNNSDTNNISSTSINSELIDDNDLTFSTLWGNTEENIELFSASDSLDYQLNEEVGEISISINSEGNYLEESITNLSNSTEDEIELNEENLREFESDSFYIIDDVNNDFSPINNSFQVNNSFSSQDKYRGVFARVPKEYARSGILVRLSERNGYLYGYESGMTFKKIQVPLHRVIKLENE